MNEYNSQRFEIDNNNEYIRNSNENIQLQSSTGETDAQMDDENEEAAVVWSIDDDTLFHPLGLINHGTESKSVFVTWSENYLLNYVFKKSSRNEGTKLTKVRLDVHGEEIREILILEYNTLLLMQSGRVFHFSSVKSMHPIKWLNGVRCISASIGGFSVIKQLSDNSLHLEVYQDVINIERSESTRKESYDITFDEMNIFNCSWQDERFTLLSQIVNELNVIFLETLIHNVCSLRDKREIHFFTVSGNIFALIAESDNNSEGDNDFIIQLCVTYASNIKFIKILSERNLLLVFLQCGTIDMCQMSNRTEQIKRTTHCTGADIIHYEFANNDCFYYTDSEQVSCIKFIYDPNKVNSCCVEVKTKTVYGIMAVTWMESIQKLICLSSNNIFYQLGFDEHRQKQKPHQQQQQQQQYECDFNELYELTPSKLARLQQEANILAELQDAPGKIYKSIEEEYLKQELITIATKSHLYRKLCKARIEYRKYIPKRQTNVSDTTTAIIVMYSNTNCVLNENSLFAFIYLDITSHKIFQAAFKWFVYITNDANGESYIFSIKHEILHKSMCFIIPFVREEQQLLPKFHLMLNAFVRIDTECAAVSLMVNVEQTNDALKHLFSLQQTNISNNYATNNCLYELISNFNRAPSIEQRHNKSTPFYSIQMTLPKNCSFQKILKLFHILNNPIPMSTTIMHEIYFLSKCFTISNMLKEAEEMDEDCLLSLQCADAAVLYYVKYYILAFLKDLPKNTNATQHNGANHRKKLLLQYQAEIERCYGQQIVSMDHALTPTLHSESLQRIYHNLRAQHFKFCAK